MNKDVLDHPTSVREGEHLDKIALQEYLWDFLGADAKIINIKQFPSGFSNLTYLVELKGKQLVLRKPPIGADIKSAHDMAREYRVLQALAPAYAKIPKVILQCESPDILGAPFYLMERITGVVLRKELPQPLAKDPTLLRQISRASIKNLAELHQLKLDGALSTLGKPLGYASRQIDGWIKRYRACQNTTLAGMELAVDWMSDHQPEDLHAFIHNDYKYDNLMLHPETWDIIAVLDWEMATLGHPYMDLGTTLGYWAETNDHPALRPFSLTWLPGNLDRQEVVDNYFDSIGQPPTNMLPYYVFGCFKIGVIVQQIYARYLQGITKDQRFAQLGHVVNACAKNIQNALKYQRINHFY